MFRVLISNVGFGEASHRALKTIQQEAYVTENVKKTRFTENDFVEKVGDVNILIAGTEKITKSVMECAPHLKLIARVGVGVDNIDLEFAKSKNISISYTPDAPSEAMPEFTISLILNLLKGISISDRKMHEKDWYRPMGRMLSSLKIGIVGVGKIGSQVARLIKLLEPSSEILFYDPYVKTLTGARKCDLETLFKNSDLVSLHLPLNTATKGLIGKELLKQMKQGSYLVNTSRGGIVDEDALYHSLQVKQLAGAALDVFEHEPYSGNLQELDNCLLTSHIGSMTYEVRALMEDQVAEDVIRFINKKPIIRFLEGFNFAR